MATAPVTRGPAGERAAQNIERSRKAQGLSQKELSDLLKAGGRPTLPTVISKIERGDRRIDVDDLIAIADALGISPLALLGFEQWEKLEGTLYRLLLFVASSGEMDYDLFSQALDVAQRMRMITPEHAEAATRVYIALRGRREAKYRESSESAPDGPSVA